jgi:tetratricopeptide (TPR) repeat protein
VKLQIECQPPIGVINFFNLTRLEMHNEAIEKLTDTYHLNTNFLDTLISRGNVYVDYGTVECFEKAQRDYEHVLLKNANNLDAHINLAYLYQITGKFKRAWDQFSEAIDKNESESN